MSGTASNGREAVLRCTVRACGRPLAAIAGSGDRTVGCEAGHRFDRARSGYLNLLQPQDRRSTQAGDLPGAAHARRRLAAAGALDGWIAFLAATICELDLPPAARVLDVGCGEGSPLAALAAALAPDAAGAGIAPHGLDLSVPAIELAARAWPDAAWVVANADRGLPWMEGSFDLVLSLTARLPAAETRRVLRPGGVAIVAVPGSDDLVELRAAILGAGEERDDRLERAIARCAGELAVARTLRWRERRALDAAALADLLAASYRGQRRSQEPRVAALVAAGGATVTASRDVAVLRR